MQLFLTGGTGFIGHWLTEALLGRGYGVVVAARRPDSPAARALAGMGARVIYGDVTERDSLHAGMREAELVIHNAGMYELGLDAAGRRRMQAVNVDGTRNVLDMALELGVPRALHVSTTFAFGESGQQMRDETFERNTPCKTCYEQTKTEAHAIAREYQARGLPLVIACPNGVVGPNDHSIIGYFLRMYINRLLPPVSSCPGAVSGLVEVHDLARGLVLAAEKGRSGETYFFSGDPHSQKDMLAEWYKHPGGARIRAWLPSTALGVMLQLFAPLERRAGLPAFMSAESVRAIATNLNYSSMKAERELGWRHCPTEDMWRGVFLEEQDLLRRRKKRDLVSRLKPVPSDELC